MEILFIQTLTNPDVFQVHHGAVSGVLQHVLRPSQRPRGLRSGPGHEESGQQEQTGLRVVLHTAALHSVRPPPAEARHTAAGQHPRDCSHRQAGHGLPEVRQQEVHENFQVSQESAIYVYKFS